MPERHSDSRPAQVPSEDSSKAPDWIGSLSLAILVLYVVLLGIGMVAEALDIRAILAWPIY